uniref:Uncharacterized protein n=1 Tax=Arundo donax TaxID=35708 RepID=A0A0A9GUY3_ARUDO
MSMNLLAIRALVVTRLKQQNLCFVPLLLTVPEIELVRRLPLVVLSWCLFKCYTETVVK